MSCCVRHWTLGHIRVLRLGPGALRIHRIGRDYSMTWSFAGPDGRALFRLAEVAGEPVVIWLRVGNHDIYHH
jgi:hypothetical protein